MARVVTVAAVDIYMYSKCGRRFLVGNISFLTIGAFTFMIITITALILYFKKLLQSMASTATATAARKYIDSSKANLKTMSYIF